MMIMMVPSPERIPRSVLSKGNRRGWGGARCTYNQPPRGASRGSARCSEFSFHQPQHSAQRPTVTCRAVKPWCCVSTPSPTYSLNLLTLTTHSNFPIHTRPRLPLRPVSRDSIEECAGHEWAHQCTLESSSPELKGCSRVRWVPWSVRPSVPSAKFRNASTQADLRHCVSRRLADGLFL